MDYLEHFRKSAVFKKVDLSHVPCGQAAKVYKEVKDDWNYSKPTPESDAIQFYLGNHAFSLLSQKYDAHEPLGDMLPVAEKYVENLAVSGSRLFYYLLLICTRESRHASESSNWYDSLKNRYPKGCVPFLKRIKGCSSSGAVRKFIDNPPKTNLADYSNFMVDVFLEGGFSGGYGGEAWADIAKCLAAYCNGEITMEMMVDTAWTLCHNNGPIFNKGIIFQMYDDYQIKMILDVQRAGMIPQFVEESDDLPTYHVNGGHADMQKLVKKAFPEFGGYVDWFAVEELGGVQNYSDLQSKQKQKHGLPKHVKLKQAAAKAAQEEAAAKLAAQEAHRFYVGPKDYVIKITREEYHAAA
jgi:hypothetical protein